MIGKLMSLLGKGAKKTSGQSIVVERLRQHARRIEVECQNLKEDVESLDVFCHKNQAVLLTQPALAAANSERANWPQGNNQFSKRGPEEGDGFWDRAVSRRRESIRRKQILDAMEYKGD